jgi:hypothetical protein
MSCGLIPYAKIHFAACVLCGLLCCAVCCVLCAVLCAQDDWSAYAKMNAAVGKQCQIVGDDLLVTNPTRIAKAIKDKSCNALLLKVPALTLGHHTPCSVHAPPYVHLPCSAHALHSVPSPHTLCTRHTHDLRLYCALEWTLLARTRTRTHARTCR